MKIILLASNVVSIGISIACIVSIYRNHLIIKELQKKLKQ